MKYKDTEEKLNTNKTKHEETTLKDDEKEALNYVKGIKEFLSHGLFFILFLIVVLIKKDTISIDFFWPMIVWAIGLTIHGLMAFEWLNLDRFGLFSPKWEKKIIEKRIGRKL